MAFNTPKPLNPAHLSPEELQFLTKKPFYNNVIIDSYELRQRFRLENPRQMNITKHTCAGFGCFDKLPVEIQFHIFDVTPISTLFSLLKTCSHAKRLIEQWEPFRTVMKEGSDAVRALLATGAGLLWTMYQVTNVLFSSECELCGEHGEFLQLLKLKRCCFQCLSQERGLLAISERYASIFLNLSHNELLQLPHLRTLPQKSFWVFPVKERQRIFDYNAALDFVRQRPRQKGPRPLMPPMVGPLAFQTTGHRLERKERSIQPRPKSTIQARRYQAPLNLLSEEVYPLETIYAQHACTVRLPGKSRQITRLASGRLKTIVSTVEAVHCAGCAFYWNYHSPLPWQFHRLYPRQEGNVDTAFTRHLQNCVYAKLQWAWIHNPWRMPNPEDIIIRSLGKQIQTRSGKAPGPKENALFEHIPDHMIAFLQTADWDADSFQPQYSWPRLTTGDDESSSSSKMSSYAAEELLERIRDREPQIPVVKLDHYWDCLVSQEAVSQANWACANTASGKVFLFGGPVAVMMEKHRRLQNKGFRMPVLGLGEMYL